MMITFSMNKFNARCKQQGSQRWIVLSSTRFFSQPRRSLCSSAFRFQLIEKLIQSNVVVRRFELQWLWPNANPLGRFPFLSFHSATSVGSVAAWHKVANKVRANLLEPAHRFLVPIWRGNSLEN